MCGYCKPCLTGEYLIFYFCLNSLAANATMPARREAWNISRWDEPTTKLTSNLGRHFKCQNSHQFGTANLDEGCFGTGVAWDVSALFKIPDQIASESAGPLMCGGASEFLTSFLPSSVRHVRHANSSCDTAVWGPLYEHGFQAGDRIG